MFGELAPVRALERAAYRVAAADRAKYAPFITGALQVINDLSHASTAVTDDYALAALSDVSELPDPPLVLLVAQDDAEVIAKKIARHLYTLAPMGLGMYAAARGAVNNIAVSVEGRDIVIVRATTGKLDEMIIDAPIGALPVQCVDPVALLVSVFARICDPANIGEWPHLLARAAELRDLVVTGGRRHAAVSERRRAAVSERRHAAVSERRHAAVSERRYTKLHHVTKPLEWFVARAAEMGTRITADTARIMYIVPDLAAEERHIQRHDAALQLRRRSVGVPTDDRLNKLTVLAHGQPIVDIFDATRYGCVMVQDGRAAAATQLWMLYADYYGTLYTARQKAALAPLLGRRCRELQAAIDSIGAADLAASLVPSEDHFVGTRVPEELYRKIIAQHGLRQITYFAGARDKYVGGGILDDVIE